MNQRTNTHLHVVDPVSPAMAARQHREDMKASAAWALYEALRLPTMPAWGELPSKSRNRFRNAIAMASSSVDMTRVAQECGLRPVRTSPFVGEVPQ